MNSHSMLEGIIDIYEACIPNASGFISSERLREGKSF